MSVTVVVGGFFGDEGKGKIVSYLAVKDEPAAAVRGGVGPNAGHTIIHEGKEIRLRMLPSAVANPRVKLMVGPGVLVNPSVLLDEVGKAEAQNRVIVDRHCTIIEPHHIEKDRGTHLGEKIGTTGTGTGPANADRALRVARIAKDFPELLPYLGDVAYEVNKIADEGSGLIVEGTQGTYLSLFHGTYPYVTSKDVCASAICADIGLGPKKVDDVLVVFKAYVTRVGGGPLENELPEEEVVRRGWREFGAVTGRLRRAGPFDFQLAKRAVMLNSATQLAMTKMDVVFKEAKGVRRYSDLPYEASKFVEDVEGATGVSVTLIGTGPGTHEIIDRRSG